ncbi:MAG: pimeloyl-ACP methyl ester carboxylesterase [Verrucomicrobiales bacterium]|jgi:pimeloyl-ACP methyl ester carboxylesterase
MALCIQRVAPHMRFFARRRWLLILVASLLAAACASSDDAVSSGAATNDATSRQDEVEEEEAVAIPDTTAAIDAGSVASGSVEIDGTTIDYVTSVPDGFSIGDEAPLLFAFPPGGQDLDLTRSLVERTYAPEAHRLGWVVISPAAPGGQLFFQGSESLVPGFLDWVETWVRPEGGSPHVAGVSNGGISTFRYAALNPTRIQSLIVFPGFPRSEEDEDALSQLVDVPMRLFVGGDDTRWIPPAEDAVTRSIDLGGDAALTIFEGEGHIIDSTRDGTLIFELLESFR